MIPEKDKQFYKLTKDQIGLYKRTGLFPYPTSTGEINLSTGKAKVDWIMSEDIKVYIQEQLDDYESKSN